MTKDFMEFKKTIRLSRYCTYCGAKMPICKHQIPKFVKKSQKEDKDDYNS